MGKELIKSKYFMNIPQHIAIIMDGNGRWAKKKGLNRVDGHREGAKAVDRVVTACLELGVKHLTLFTFSTENWQRPAIEIKALMELLKRYLVKEQARMVKEGIKFRAIGELERLPNDVKKILYSVMENTKEGNKLNLILALSYGGRSEIKDAVIKIAQKVKRGEIQPEEITEDTVRNNLYLNDVPDPDLLIRSSGEMRISNFLLWEIAYSEIYITEVLWPDFTKDHIIEAIEDFNSRDRRFGKIDSSEYVNKSYYAGKK